MVGLTDAARRGAAAAGPGRGRAARGHRARRLRLLDRRRRTGTPATAAALEQANGAAHPTARLTGVEAAYWTDVGTKEHLRWVMPRARGRPARRPRPAARGAAGTSSPRAPGWSGMFRAHGLLVPVWDLPARHRRRGPRGAGRAVRRRSRRGARRHRRPDPGGALGPLGPREPSGHDPLTPPETARGELSPARRSTRFSSPGRCCIPRQQRPGPFHFRSRSPGVRPVASSRPSPTTSGGRCAAAR